MATLRRSMAGSELDSLRTDAILTFTVNAVGGVLLVLHLAMWSRSLSPAEFGILVLAIATSNIVRPLLDLGLNNALIQGVAFHQNTGNWTAATGLLHTSTAIRAVASLALLGLALPVASVIANSLYRDPSLTSALASGVVIGTLLGVRQHIESMLRSNRRFRRIAALNVARYVTPVIASSVFINLGHATVGNALIAFALNPVLFIGLGWFAARDLLPRSFGRGVQVNRAAARSLAGFAVWVAIVRVLDIASQLDVPTINYFLAPELVAYYYAGYKVLDLFSTLGASVSFVLLPHVSAVAASPAALRGLPTVILSRIFAIALPAGALVWMFRADIVDFVWGPTYGPAAEVVQYLVPGAVCSLLMVGAGEILMAQRRPARTVPIAALSFVSNITLLLILVPRMGIVGAAVATSASYALIVVAAWTIVFTSVKTRPRIGPFVPSVVATIALVLAASVVIVATPDGLQWDLLAALGGVAAYFASVILLIPEVRRRPIPALIAVLEAVGVLPPDEVARPFQRTYGAAPKARQPAARLCLTADVHNRSASSLDQEILGAVSEVQCAQSFSEIAKRYGLRLTMFVSGRVAVESCELLRALAADGALEIGAHEYDAFAEETLKIVWHRAFGTYGPARMQADGIRRARNALKLAGVDASSWSSHSYREDRNTLPLLRQAGFSQVCNVVDGRALLPSRDDGLLRVPTNVPPDHEYMRHPGRASVRPDALDASDWLDFAMDQIEDVAARGGLPTLRLHPACQAAVDGFATFERLCDRLSSWKTLTIRELGTGSYTDLVQISA